MRYIANASVVMAVTLLISACGSFRSVTQVDNPDNSADRLQTEMIQKAQPQKETIDKTKALPKAEPSKEPAGKIEQAAMDRVEIGSLTDKVLNDGRAAPNFNLADTNGKLYSMADYRGEKVYIKYWASWCPVCLAGMEDFDKLVKASEKSGEAVVFSMVPTGAFGEKTSADFIRWYKDRGYTFPVLLDEGGQVARQLGVRAFPTSVYIGSDGVLIAAIPGQSSNETIAAKLAAFR
ncbi:MAG: TlpA disulfide reductase family protein [Negativicutes bacterium]|nr:TlpA disulfide reductase family protein [Negativicutes bacterium]